MKKTSDPRRFVRALAVMVAVAAGCDVCGLVDQEIVVAADDPELGALISDCRDGVVSPPEAMCEEAPAANGISCACRPLCARVFAIVDADPHPPALRTCVLEIDAQDQARITIEYRSVCQ
jgi:hypothetical protein